MTRERKGKKTKGGRRLARVLANRGTHEGHYEVRFSIRQCLFGEQEPEGVLDVDGHILHVLREEEERGEAVEVGIVEGTIAHPCDTWDFSEACDCHSHELLRAYEAVYDASTEEPHKDIPDLHDVCTEGLLLLRRLEVDPAHRGQDLGLAAATRFLDAFHHGCGIAVCKPFPLQFEDPQAERTEAALAEQAAAIAKLVKHWGRLGFSLLPKNHWDGAREPMMAMNLEYERPSRRALGLEAYGTDASEAASAVSDGDGGSLH
jgi:GNAT superfamily N-acetyltransferase